MKNMAVINVVTWEFSDLMIYEALKFYFLVFNLLNMLRFYVYFLEISWNNNNLGDKSMYRFINPNRAIPLGPLPHTNTCVVRMKFTNLKHRHGITKKLQSPNLDRSKK